MQPAAEKTVRRPASSFGLIRRLHWALRIWGLVLFLLLVVGAVLIAEHPRTTAHVEATSEVIDLRTTDARGLHWPLAGYSVTGCLGGAAVNEASIPADTSLVVGPGVAAHIERPEGAAEVTIVLKRIGALPPDGGACGGTPLAEIAGADGSVRPLAGARIVLKHRFGVAANAPWTENATLLPIKGQVEVGREVGDDVDRVLLGGSMAIHAAMSGRFTDWLLDHTKRKRTYIGETLALQRGDRILPIPTTAQLTVAPDQDASGYVRIPANGVLQVSYYGPMDRVVIQRSGSATVEAELSIWSRFENEPTLTLMGSLIVFMIAVLELWGTAGEIHDRTCKEEKAEVAHDKANTAARPGGEGTSA